MKNTILIQNQTEMANYGHADARPVLTRLGRNFTLLTAETIGTLDDIAASGQADCIFVGSNALHDPIIRNYLESEEGKGSIAELIRSNAGFVLMMQYKAAYDGYELPLPPALGSVKAIPRPDQETSVTSKLVLAHDRASIPLLAYPNRISPESLESAGRAHASLAGVYWHYWELDDLSLWDTHLACRVTSPDRPLIAAAKEHTGTRVILSALPVDWQGNDQLVDNLITYALEGRHSTAFLRSTGAVDITAQYLSAKLSSRGTSHRVYGPSEQDRADAARHTDEGIHNTLYITDGDDLGAYFSSQAAARLQKKLDSGSLRLVAMHRDGDAYRVKVSGQHSAARDAYDLLVPAVAKTLLAGFLDGSFRGTVSGLQELEHLPHGLDISLFPLGVVLAECQRRDRNGSYDEVIGATAALLWLRGKALGPRDESTKSTLKWLRERLVRTDPRECLHSLGVLHELGLISQVEQELADDTLGGLDLSAATEIELIAFLEAATRFNSLEIVDKIVAELTSRQRAGRGPIWIDIPTTAGLVKALIRVRHLDSSSTRKRRARERTLFDLVIPSMMAIEEGYHRSTLRMSAGAFPWDGKASTALRCLSAWYLFEQWLAAPVEEAAEAIARSSRRGALQTLAEGSVRSLRQIFERHDEARATLARQASDLASAAEAEQRAADLQRNLQTVLHRSRFILIFALVISYLCVDHVVRTRFLSEVLQFGDSLVKHWGVHVAAATFLVAVFAVPWDKVGSAIDRMQLAKLIKR